MSTPSTDTDRPRSQWLTRLEDAKASMREAVKLQKAAVDLSHRAHEKAAYAEAIVAAHEGRAPDLIGALEARIARAGR